MKNVPFLNLYTLFEDWGFSAMIMIIIFFFSVNYHWCYGNSLTGTLIIWLQLFRKRILCNLQYMYPPIYLSVWWWTSLTCVGISQVSSERYYQCCLPSLISPICFMLWWLHCICFSWHGLFRSQPESSYCPTWNS